VHDVQVLIVVTCDVSIQLTYRPSCVNQQLEQIAWLMDRLHRPRLLGWYVGMQALDFVPQVYNVNKNSSRIAKGYSIQV